MERREIRPTNADGKLLSPAALAFLEKIADRDGVDWKYAFRYVQATGIIQDWMERMLGIYQADDNGISHKWTVTHLGREYETAAVSERAAINCVRYRLYGIKPLAECPPFEARISTKPNGYVKSGITKAEALKRLARMAS